MNNQHKAILLQQMVGATALEFATVLGIKQNTYDCKRSGLRKFKDSELETLKAHVILTLDSYEVVLDRLFQTVKVPQL